MSMYQLFREDETMFNNYNEILTFILKTGEKQIYADGLGRFLSCIQIKYKYVL